MMAFRAPMRSFTRTTTDWPVSWSVTRTRVPKGMLRLAAVKAS